MSEFKGTKGKWEVVKDEFYGNTLVKHNVFTICKVNDIVSDTIENANALLISKAPEMLEMLIRMTDFTKEPVQQEEVLELIKQATEI